jgi:hypothetical protein
MDDPEAQVKSSLLDCTCLEDLSMTLSSRHLELIRKRTDEHLYLFIYLFIYFSLILLFPPFFFSSYSIIIYFFFCSSELLQHTTYTAFVRDDAMTPPPCLNDARLEHKREGK